MKYIVIIMMMLFVGCSDKEKIAEEDVHDSDEERGLKGCKHGFPKMTTTERLLVEKLYADDLALSEKEYPQGSIVSHRFVVCGGTL